MYSISDIFWGFIFPAVTLGGGGLLLIYRFFHNNSVKDETIVQSSVQSIDFFKNRNFFVSKEINLNMPSITETLKFVVDDYSKKFGFYRFNSVTNLCDLEIYNYSDLLDFNLRENGKQMIPGRGMMAAGGAFLFGVQGAIIGSVAGDKEIKNLCTELTIQIKLNNLHKPLILIGLLGGSYDKESRTYLNAKQKADEIIATLTFIEANKEAKPSEATNNHFENTKPAKLDLKDFLS